MSTQGKGFGKLKRLREAVASDPESAKAQLRLGTALLRARLYEEAETALLRAVEIDPGYAEAWVNLGGLRFTRWDYAGCVTANTRAIEADPDLVQAHYNLGLAHLYLNQPEEMVPCFAKVVEKDPDNAGGHYHLAIGLHALGMRQEAQVALGVSLELGFAPQPEIIREFQRGSSAQIVELGPKEKKKNGGSKG